MPPTNPVSTIDPNSNFYTDHLAKGNKASILQDSHIAKPAEIDPYQTISNMDMKNIVGAPLTAMLEAMKDSTAKTIRWIAENMFDNTNRKLDPTTNTYPEWGNPKMLTFQYSKTSPLGMPIPSKLKIPLMIMVPIPHLRLEFITVDFLCKVNSVHTQEQTHGQVAINKEEAFVTETATDGSSGTAGTENTTEKEATFANSSLGSVMAMNVERKNTKLGTTVSKDFSYQIKVKAVQDETPPGIEKLFEILDSLVKETAGDEQNFETLLNPMKAPGLSDFGFSSGQP